MEIQHRYFIQYMLKNGVVPIKKALSYCRNIPQGSVNDISQLKPLITTINSEISKQYFKIASVTCEVTNQDLFVWVNNKNDDVSKLQITFSAIELEYFHVIMNEILNSEDYKLTFVVVLNLTSTLTAHFSRDSGQKVLTKWFNGGYFVKKEDFVYLGPRLIFEFTSYLKSHCPDQICKLCSELVFTSTKCSACDGLFHSFCLEKYLSKQNKCPCCQNNWIEKTNDLVPSNTQEMENIEDQHMSEESIDMETGTSNIEETTPRTSSEGVSQRRQNFRKRIS